MPAAASIVKSLDGTGYRAPKEARETSFFCAKGATMFEWLKYNPEQRKSFDNYMAFRRKNALRWFEVFPITDQFLAGLRSDPHAVLIVDVGGSHGHDLLSLKQRFPGLPGRMILQDLPETIDLLGGVLSGIEPMAYNFYNPQPVTGELTSNRIYKGRIASNRIAQVLEFTTLARSVTIGPTTIVSNSCLIRQKLWTKTIRSFSSMIMLYQRLEHPCAQLLWTYR